MGKITGFLEVKRLQEASEPPANRLKHWKEFVLHLSDEQAGNQLSTPSSIRAGNKAGSPHKFPHRKQVKKSQ